MSTISDSAIPFVSNRGLLRNGVVRELYVWGLGLILGLLLSTSNARAESSPPPLADSSTVGVHGKDGSAAALRDLVRITIPEVAEEITKEIRAKTVQDHELFGRLTNQQLYEVLLAREENKGEPEAVVAVVAPLGFFLTVIAVVALVLVFRSRSEQIRHDTIREAMDKGVEVPTELLLPRGTRRSDLRRGLVFVAGGLGLISVLVCKDGVGDRTWAIGMFPLMVGLGYLVFWYLDRNGMDGPKAFKF